VLKTKLEISMPMGFRSNEFRTEKWATQFPAPNATSHDLDMLWNGRPVLREARVYADGGRAGLPLSDPGTDNVPSRKLQLFRLVDSTGRYTIQFDEYWIRSGLTSIDRRWP
jgi:hypothetical protein